MHPPTAWIALSACVLCLGACEKTPTTPPTPVVNAPAPTDARATAGSAADPSVPSAESVFPPTSVTKVDAPPERSNRTMSAAQESTAMPMPGQNNDHSAPLTPAKPASSP